MFKFIVGDIIGNFFYLPVWWYTSGALRFLKKMGRSFLGMERQLGLRIWTANLFTPMFGQVDLVGKIISFFMRVFQIISRTVMLILWFSWLMLVMAGYLLLPLIAAWQIWLHSVSLFE